MILGALVLLALVFASPTVARRPVHHDPCHGHRTTASAAQRFEESVWILTRWERGSPPPATITAWHHKLKCAVGPGHRRAMKARWRRDRRAFYSHRHAELERQRLEPNDCGSYRSAIPCYITACESGGDIHAKNPSSSAGGKYQILDTTWAAYGGRPYPGSHPAAEAPPAEQDRIAAAIYHDSGPAAWSCG